MSGLPIEFAVDHLWVALSSVHRFHVVTVRGFGTEQEAADFLPRVLAGLAHLLLERDMFGRASRELQRDVYYTDDPERLAGNVGLQGAVDAVVHGDSPAVYLTDKRVRSVVGNPVGLLMTTGGESVAQVIGAGMRHQNAAVLLGDEKLQTALELYGSTFVEETARSNFISLVMALEALAERQQRPALSRVALRALSAVLRAVLTLVPAGSENAHAIDGLLRELDFRGSDSIRGSVRRLVATLLARDVDVQQTVKETLQVYDQRSKLVHDGALPQGQLNQSVETARKIVKRVINARIRSVLGA